MSQKTLTSSTTAEPTKNTLVEQQAVNPIVTPVSSSTGSQEIETSLTKVNKLGEKKEKEWVQLNLFDLEKFRDIESGENQSAVEKDSSSSPPEKFQFVLRGELLTENDSEVFRLENGAKIKVKRVVASSNLSGIANWQVVPTTDNEGQVVGLILEKPLPQSALRVDPSGLLIEAGRIVEVAKKRDRIKVKVKRTGSKDVKITVLDADKEMKPGQLWEMRGIMKESRLYIQEAKYLQD